MAGTAVHQVCFHLLSVSYAHDYVRIALFAVGYLWLLAIPSSQFGQRTYIDENALQPSSVLTKWGWDDVHAADRYLESLDALRARNASRTE